MHKEIRKCKSCIYFRCIGKCDDCKNRDEYGKCNCLQNTFNICNYWVKKDDVYDVLYKKYTTTAVTRTKALNATKYAHGANKVIADAACENAIKAHDKAKNALVQYQKYLIAQQANVVQIQKQPEKLQITTPREGINVKITYIPIGFTPLQPYILNRQAEYAEYIAEQYKKYGKGIVYYNIKCMRDGIICDEHEGCHLVDSINNHHYQAIQIVVRRLRKSLAI